MHDTVIRLGLIGVGKIVRDQHLPAIAGNPRFELVATASPEGSIPNIPAHPNLESMLAAGHRLDAICICTPPAVRGDLAYRALEAGHHVMLEKPPAAGLSQIGALVAKAETANRCLLATWHSRETAAVDAARAWLAARPVTSVRVVWREDIRVWHPGQDWLLAAGGFGVFDPAINAFSILTHILPEPLVLEGADLFIPENRDAPTRANLAMRHGGLAPVLCELSICHEGSPEWDIFVETDSGSLQLAQGGHRFLIDGEVQTADADGEYARIYARFAALVEKGGVDVDPRPMTLVADAMMRGRVHRTPSFNF